MTEQLEVKGRHPLYGQKMYEGIDDDSLGKFVDEFTAHPSVLSQSETFPATLKNYKENIRRDNRERERSLAAILQDVPLYCQSDSRSQAMLKIMENFMSSELRVYYDQIYPTLFDLKVTKKFSMKTSEYYSELKEAIAEIPIFISVPFGTQQSVWEYKFTSKDKRQSEYEHKLEVKVPEISRSAKESVKKALSRYYEICSKGLQRPFIGDLLNKHLLDGTAGIKFSMHWIPKDEEFQIKTIRTKDDPIVTAQVYYTYFLIDKWDIKGEKPFEHYLAEFTENSRGDLHNE